MERVTQEHVAAGLSVGFFCILRPENRKQYLILNTAPVAAPLYRCRGSTDRQTTTVQ
jgi:hypothetical protein